MYNYDIIKIKEKSFNLNSSWVHGCRKWCGICIIKSNAGAALQGWYLAVFNNTYLTFNSLDTYFTTKFATMTSTVDADATTAANELKNYSQPETSANASIEDLSNTHLANLASVKTVLESKIPADYQLYTGNYNLGFNNRVESDAVSVIQNVTNTVNNAGTTAVGVVNSNVTATKNAEVARLTEAITKAKEDLQKLNDVKAAKLVTDVQGNIDTKIADKQNDINDLIDQLEATKKTLIENKAQEIETAAETELNNAVTTGLEAMWD